MSKNILYQAVRGKSVEGRKCKRTINGIPRDKYYEEHGTHNCSCVICGKSMYMKPSRLKRAKHGITCSKECDAKNRSKWFSGENNHQFGLKGDLNPTFSGYKHYKHGYVVVYKPDHPFCDKKGKVLEHRLVVENNWKLFDLKYFIEIDGQMFLRKEIEVHHKNEIRDDNRIENLIPVTSSEHCAIHNARKEIVRDAKGRIVRLKKKEFLA